MIVVLNGVFGLCTMEARKRGGKETIVYISLIENSEFVDGEVNLADCSSTARADCFFDLLVRLYDDRNNKRKDVYVLLFRSLAHIWSTISGSQIFISIM